MSKVISFSISDRYLDKLRSLYPSLTDNLAAKQFITDRLDSNLDDKLDDDLKTLIESSLSSSLDDSLDGILDDKVKTIIETSLDGILDERLDDAVGKLITSLSERMARLESRLDDNLDDGLDDMEPLLKREKECSIASPIPTIEETSPRDEPGEDAIEDSQKKILETVGGSESLNTLPVPLIADKTIDQNAIETLTGETDSTIESVTGEGIENRQGLTNAQLSEKTRVPIRTIQDWANKIQKGKKTTSTKYPDFFTHWTLNPNDNLWYPIN